MESTNYSHFISDIFGLLFQATKELRDVTQ